MSQTKANDTTALRDAIKNANMSYASVERQMSKITGRPTKTCLGVIYGYIKATDNDISALAQILKKPEKTIAEMMDGTAPELASRTFDYDALISATKKAGLTPNKVCSILGTSTASYSHWKSSKKGPNADTVKRLTALLNIKEDELYKVVEPKVKEEQVPAEPTTQEKSATPGFKQINTQNILEIFAIVNENILALAENLDKVTRLNEQRYNSLSEKLDSIEKALHGKEESSITESAPQPQSKEPDSKEESDTNTANAIDILRSEYKELANAYNNADDFSAYREKINRMVNLITTRTHDTHKQTLHQLYDELNRTYGAVYSQLEKEFYSVYGRKANGTTELIYNSEMFRNIFYNICSDRLGKAIA